MRAALSIVLLLRIQDQATQAQSAVDVQALSGEIQVWRQRTRKIEKTSARIVVQPEDRLGSPAGAVSRISIGDVVLILRGVDPGATSDFKRK